MVAAGHRADTARKGRHVRHGLYAVGLDWSK